jgi:hypothetical protein
MRTVYDPHRRHLRREEGTMKARGAVVLGVSLAVAAWVPAHAQTANVTASVSRETTLAQVGYGAGSAFGTLVYAPLKGTFCILGGLGSAFVLPFSTKTAGEVATGACAGTWVITPDAVRGKAAVKFVGG